MSEPTSQLEERYGDLAVAADELRDAVAEAGPNDEEQERVLEVLADKHPQFLSHLVRLISLRASDDASEITAASASGKIVVKLVGDQTDKVVATLQKEKANRMLAALVALGVSARLNGLTKWTPPADAVKAAAEEL